MSLLARLSALLLLALSVVAAGGPDGRAEAQSGIPDKDISHLERLVELDTADLTEAQRLLIDNWLATAQRAEEAISAGRASNAALESLRSEIVDFRNRFEVARSQNSARIETLRSQLKALGPEPENAEDEAAEIAVLRGGLKQRIQQLRVPVVISSEAYNRADGIINEIDRILRDRQAKRLLLRTGSPLNPQYWLPALRSVGGAIGDLVSETRIFWSSRAEWKQLQTALPQILLMSAIALVLIVMGRFWAQRLGDWARSFGGRGSGIWGTLISLGRIGLPLLGIWLLTNAIIESGALGFRGALIVEAIPLWAVTVLGFQWLGDRVYSRQSSRAIADWTDEQRDWARWMMVGFGLTLVLYDMVLMLERIETLSDETRAVLGLPVLVIGSVLLLWLRRIGLGRGFGQPSREKEAQPRGSLQRIGPIVRQTSLVVGIATPVMAVAGFGALAEAILYPYILSLAVLSAAIVFQRIFADIYIWAIGAENGDDLLVPAVMGLVLALLALPLLALIWGVRSSDLLELWDQFLLGVQIGDTRISPGNFITFAVVFVIGYMLTRMVQTTLRTNLLPKTGLDVGGQTALVSGVGYVGIFLAALIAVSTAGIDLSSLAIVAGALSVGIGFGLQTIVSNFVSGIILLIERPVAEGDWIEVGGFQGYVRDISVRATRIETFDRQDVIVPNSELVSGAVVNYTRGNTIGRLVLGVGVAYGTDTGKVDAILREIAEAHPMVLANPAPSIVFRGFGADSLDFEIRAILRDVNWVLSVRSEMNHQINKRFVEEGIEIPFAQRDVWLRNAEALHPPADVTQTPPRPAGPVPPELQDRDGDTEGDDG